MVGRKTQIKGGAIGVQDQFIFGAQGQDMLILVHGFK